GAGGMALCWLLIHILLFTSSSAHNDFFTSIGHMTDLLFTEKDLVNSLKDYIRAEERKLEQIKKWADKLDVLSAAAGQDPEGFLGHPVNAFKLMKRLNTEWGELESLVLTDVSDVCFDITTILLFIVFCPGSSSSHQSVLTVDDCYDLGKVAYSEADYYHTELWMVQALKQLDEGEISAVDAVTILDYLSYSVYQQGDLERSLDFTKRLLELDPTHQRANGNLKYFEYQLAKQEKMGASEEAQTEEAQRKGRPDDYLPERKKYEQLCRGEGLRMTPRRQSRLFCRYYNNNRHPKYVIGPVKQEDEWDQPRIVRYLNIVTDKEMEKVKELAKPRYLTLSVTEPWLRGRTVTQFLLSPLSAWLGAFEHPVVDEINQRIEDLTGLDVTTAEDLQVANYGVGGQYEPHFDFGRKDEPDAFEELGTGNRIATWLLYMSDVQAGGATVFTDIGASVWPRKGTAVFWYNLYPSGEGDYRTRHAACPVLVGNKWVSNKWIHERGQEFRRRCGLQETD
uniref:procollagen-proline 4-dioxygenase n=1 Tax=Sparus aurata TaxID=8175 RepID=A0A671WSN6_SPAAU